MKPFVLEMLTPDSAWAERPVMFLDVPAETGRWTILANHQPMVCALRPGTVRVRTPEGAEEYWETGSGVVHVARERVALLARSLRKRSVTPPEPPV